MSRHETMRYFLHAEKLAAKLYNVPDHSWDEAWENVVTDDNGVECSCGWKTEGPEDGRLLFMRHLDEVSPWQGEPETLSIRFDAKGNQPHRRI